MNTKNDIRSTIDLLIAKQKKRINNEYHSTEYFTLNLENNALIAHTSIGSALEVKFDYILIVSFYKYKYFDYNNTKMKLVVILNENLNKTDVIKINGWVLSLYKDGHGGSSYENNSMSFNLIDKLGANATIYLWTIRGVDNFNKLDTMTKSYNTNTERNLSKKLVELEKECEGFKERLSKYEEIDEGLML